MNTAFDSYIADLSSEPDLAVGALLIARDEYKTLDVAEYIDRLDEMAADIRRRLCDADDPIAILEMMNHKLFTELEFSGNVDDYHDPRNSYLNDVLDRRLGIPITLSLIYIEVGRRLGLNIDGVSFPGHFLVRCRTDDGIVVLDPFYKGTSLGEEDLARRLESVVPGLDNPRSILGQLLASVGSREILARVLRNLRGNFIEQGQDERALGAAHKICLLLPQNAEEIKFRGYLYGRLECPRQAMEDYVRYLRLAPDASDAETIRGMVTALAGTAGSIN